jgi:hypothetical protein
MLEVVSDSDPQARARARRDWPGRVTDHAHARSAKPGPEVSASERVAMVWRMTLDAWALSGRAWPDYTRAQTPGRVIRPGDSSRDVDPR